MERTERDLIAKIVDTALELAGSEVHPMRSLRELRSEIFLAVFSEHATRPLRLDEMLTGRASDLAHDVFGIHKHFAGPGQPLTECFTPRYAVRS